MALASQEADLETRDPEPRRPPARVEQQRPRPSWLDASAPVARLAAPLVVGVLRSRLPGRSMSLGRRPVSRPVHRLAACIWMAERGRGRTGDAACTRLPPCCGSSTALSQPGHTRAPSGPHTADRRGHPSRPAPAHGRAAEWGADLGEADSQPILLILAGTIHTFKRIQITALRPERRCPTQGGARGKSQGAFKYMLNKAKIKMQVIGICRLRHKQRGESLQC